VQDKSTQVTWGFNAKDQPNGRNCNCLTHDVRNSTQPTKKQGGCALSAHTMERNPALAKLDQSCS
jgi:hypothetical protein